MAIIQGLLSLIVKSLGRVFNTLFAWATVMLFGKVSQDNQIYLSATSFGAVAWAVAVLGIAVPRVMVFLLSFATLPKGVGVEIVRYVMLGFVILIPPVIGISTRHLLSKKKERPVGLFEAAWNGYRCTAGISVTLVILTLLSPFLKIADLRRKWTTAHVPVVIEQEHYDGVADFIEQVLIDEGTEPKRVEPHWTFILPIKVLTTIAGASIDRFLAEKIIIFNTKDGEVLVHPSDILVKGERWETSRIQGLLQERLVGTKAYLSWSPTAHEIEDKLRAVAEGIQVDSNEALMETLDALAKEIHTAKLDYDEWEILFREHLIIERNLRRVKPAMPIERRSKLAKWVTVGKLIYDVASKFA